MSYFFKLAILYVMVLSAPLFPSANGPDSMNVKTTAMNKLSSFLLGVGNGFVDLGVGAINIVAHPITAIKNTGKAIGHPVQTYKASKAAFLADCKQKGNIECAGVATAQILGVVAGPSAVTGLAKTMGFIKGGEASAAITDLGILDPSNTVPAIDLPGLDAQRHFGQLHPAAEDTFHVFTSDAAAEANRWGVS